MIEATNREILGSKETMSRANRLGEIAMRNILAIHKEMH